MPGPASVGWLVGWAVGLATLAVFWAPDQQNAAGMRISGASPWQQTNATAVGNSRIEAQRSSQQGGVELAT